MKKTLKLGKLNRCVAFERESVDKDNRTVSLSFSSEEPVERWFGSEVLDHSKGAVRLKRLKTGGPLLLDHDSRKQIGVVEKVSIGDDRRGRVDVRFGKSEHAEEIYQDVLDGIRSNVSVGYQIHRMLLEEESEAGNTYRATDWEPYEVSLVSIPADISVGVGRGADDDHETNIDGTKNKENRTMNKCQFCGVEHKDGAACTCHASVAARSATPPIVDEAKVLREIQEKETKRVGFIRTLCNDAKMPEMADKLINDNRSEDQARELVLAARETRLELNITEKTEKDKRIDVKIRYNKKDLAAWGEGKDAEREAYTAGQWASGMLLGNEDAKRWCKEHMHERVMTEGVGPAGGFGVPEEMETAIINLRDEYGVVRSLATVYPMGSAQLSVPKRTSGNTAYFVGEEEAPTKSQPGLGQILLTAKKVAVETQISDELDEDNVIGIAALVADEQGQAFAEKEDACLFLGDGTSAFGGIVGLKQLSEGTAFAGRVTSTSGDDTFQEVTDGDLSRMMAAVRSYAKKGSVWLSSPTADELVFGRLLRASGGNTGAMVAGAFTPSYAGYSRVTAEDAPSGASTDYTGLTMLYYGNFKKGVAFGDRKGMTMRVLRELYASEGLIGIIANERFDLNIHDMGTTAVTGSISYLYGNS